MKINKNLIILSLLLIFCISLGAVSAADNADMSINDINNDDVATLESSVNVDDEISTVSEGEIQNSSEIYDNISSATGTYNITTDYQIDKTWNMPNANVIIEGNNHIIYGNGKQAFYITGNNVTIKNLTFMNCWSDSSGGAISFGSGGVVDNCSFVNCSAKNIGGAIDGIDSVVRDCSFVGCNATNGGAIYIVGTNNVVSGCSFINCSARNIGGAIRIDGNCSVNYCIFDNNKATKYGNAIYMGVFEKFDVDVDYNFFAFQNNVIIFPNDLIMEGDGEKSESVTPNNWVVLNIIKFGDEYVVKFVLNNDSDLDKFMLDYTASLTINNEDAKEITIKNNTFKDTLVNGVYNVNSINTGNLLTNFKFYNDSFTALNELIINSKDNTIVLDHDYKFYDDFDGDFIEGIVIAKSITIDGNNHTINGLNIARAFDVTANNVTIKNLTFVNCSASWDGGAIYVYNEGGCSVVNSSFVSCSANGDFGGAIYFEGNGSVVNSSFVNCSADHGGAITWYGANGSVVNCSFVNCDAKRTRGGAIVFRSGDYYINNCSFIGCSADGDGAAIYFEGNGSVVNCSFVNCSAIYGTIYWNDGDNGAVSNCSFVGCSACKGGAIYFEGNGSIGNCSFVNCSTTEEEGGVIYFEGNGSIGNSSFTNCTSSDYGGGAISFNGNGSIGNCSFTNCTSSDYGGGAIYVFNECNVSVGNCSFVDCNASTLGGAIHLEGNGYISGCSFVNCSADYIGGAIYFYKEGSVSDCSFVNCSASNTGGAIGSRGIINIFNSNFVDCNASAAGGAIFCYGGYSNVSGCSFVGCNADRGGAIVILNSSVNYCIFDNNDAVNGINIAIIDDSLCSANVNYNFFTFQNNVTTFLDNLIVVTNNDFLNFTSIVPDNWVVLDIVKFDDEYVVKFVDNEGYDLGKFIPDYNASLTINENDPCEITIKDNTFNGQFIEGSYLLTSSNSGIVLVNTTLNLTVPIYEIEVWDCEYGETAIINIIFKEEGVTGEIIVKISDDYIITRTINDKNRVSIPINGLSPGNYVLNISYSGNGAYLPFNTSATVIVSGSSEFDMNISVNDTLYGEVTYVVVNLPDDAIGYVELYINDKYYGDSGVRSGVATFNLSDLNPGTYDIDVVYNGTYGVARNSTNFTVTAKTVNITLSNVTEFTVLSGENYTVTFTSDGEAIDGAKVIFELVNGDIKKNYTVYTDSEGKASLPINLAYTKEYIFNIYFNNTGYEYNVTSQTIIVTVGNATFKDNFTDKTFNSTTMSGDNFTIRLVDDNKGIAGVYVDLDFKKGQNGTIVTYKIKTDSEGNVRLPLNLKYAGDYYLTAKYDTVESEEYTINIRKPTLLTNNYDGKFVTTKNSHKEFVVKLTSEDVGVEGATITFKLNNTPTTYHAVTDKDGEAKLAINISFVGNYTMKVVFEGNNIYAPSDESITSVEIKDA